MRHSVGTLKAIRDTDYEVYAAIRAEEKRQRENLVLIASENYASPAVLGAQGCLMTNKYAEGYPGKRYYGGCQYVDVVEDLAIARAKEIFGCEHVNVQPHSGSQANMAAYLSVLKAGDTILGMDLAHGGHLTHGSRVNFSGKIFQAFTYGVKRETGEIDYEAVERQAQEVRPRMIVVGASAYSKILDFPRFQSIAKSVGAYLLVDIAHIAGLVAVGLHPSPVPYADFVTTTTHKTLRGPRSGMIMCKEEHAKAVDKMIFPGIQGGPLMHVIAAKAVAFKEALAPAFKAYQKQVLANARTLAQGFLKRGYHVVSGGTENHLFLLDLSNKGVTGKDAEAALNASGIVVNKNAVPFDEKPPAVASGIRIGTPTVSTRGMQKSEMEQLLAWMDEVIAHSQDSVVHKRILRDVKDLCARFPIFHTYS
ncbi:MAG: serine hydroxymethyltransferase [Nitrospira sp.]|nr:serine hydroxymethyltransferase [Nitrospira sp.]MCB9709652.1 serine hydroxymethyltransferase [Nitrospiraceae bacterium]MDR4486983.1 serine hydroxymethyltransferase [Nitrospirales bacterium]MCA9465155.1 serine hydroxymethyltransferase [Nitrospira sp.]MCA9474996.1 serine hydroxymethyltransferase [Nitrospira sp.]